MKATRVVVKVRRGRGGSKSARFNGIWSGLVLQDSGS